MRARFKRLLCWLGLHRWAMVEQRWSAARGRFMYLHECQRDNCDGWMVE